MMTYKKNPNMKYTDMCIYFDANIYKADRDDNILYQYLYHVCYMLASKGRYFKYFEDYDIFALYSSTRLYLRYPSKDKCADTPPEKKIKSILNYTKATIYPLKVDYQRENFAQTRIYGDKGQMESLVNITKQYIQKNYSHGIVETLFDTFKTLPEIIRNRIKDTPYKNDILVSKRLYMSCLLTFINSMTLSNDKIKKISNKRNIADKEDLYIKSLQRERQDAVMTWHLDDSFKDYVRVLTNKIRRDIENEIANTQKSFSLTDSELEGIMTTAVYNTDNYRENY